MWASVKGITPIIKELGNTDDKKTPYQEECLGTERLLSDREFRKRGGEYPSLRVDRESLAPDAVV